VHEWQNQYIDPGLRFHYRSFQNATPWVCQMEELALREVSSLSLEQKASPVEIVERSGLLAEVGECVHIERVGGWEVSVVSD